MTLNKNLGHILKRGRPGEALCDPQGCRQQASPKTFPTPSECLSNDSERHFCIALQGHRDIGNKVVILAVDGLLD